MATRSETGTTIVAVSLGFALAMAGGVVLAAPQHSGSSGATVVTAEAPRDPATGLPSGHRSYPVPGL
jgi:hypothetical protein